MDLLKLKTVALPPSPPQTFLSGTREALRSLHASFATPFHAYEGALCVETGLLKRLSREDAWRYVLVVRSGVELRALVDTVPVENCAAVVALTADQREALAVRCLALTELGGAGIIFVRRGAKGRSWVRDVVRDGTWPQPVYTGEEDFALPPGWDSHGKLKAVAEAMGTTVEALTTRKAEPPAETSRLSEEAEIKRVEKAKKQALEEEKRWLSTVDSKLHARSAPPADDFFQKLLHR